MIQRERCVLGEVEDVGLAFPEPLEPFDDAAVNLRPFRLGDELTTRLLNAVMVEPVGSIAGGLEQLLRDSLLQGGERLFHRKTRGARDDRQVEPLAHERRGAQNSSGLGAEALHAPKNDVHHGGG
ncbi:MAG: hypothetical protein ACYCWW_01670 [Deltaproteobacteria bacterium]